MYLETYVIFTDFGADSYYSHVMQGYLLKLIKLAGKNLSVLRLTDSISQGDIISANYVLKTSYNYYPENSLFICVIDPGVGTNRDIVLLRNKKYWFLGPDNGLFSLINDDCEELYIFNQEKIKLLPNKISCTFHGRDIFTPLAVLLGTNQDTLDKFFIKSENQQITGIEGLTPEKTDDSIIGKIIYIDPFGNCITNIKKQDIKSDIDFIEYGEYKLDEIQDTYSGTEKLIALFGNSDFLELAVNNGSASAEYDIKQGDKVVVRTVNPL